MKQSKDGLSLCHWVGSNQESTLLFCWPVTWNSNSQMPQEVRSWYFKKAGKGGEKKTPWRSTAQRTKRTLKGQNVTQYLEWIISEKFSYETKLQGGRRGWAAKMKESKGCALLKRDVFILITQVLHCYFHTAGGNSRWSARLSSPGELRTANQLTLVFWHSSSSR